MKSGIFGKTSNFLLYDEPERKRSRPSSVRSSSDDSSITLDSSSGTEDNIWQITQEDISQHSDRSREIMETATPVYTHIRGRLGGHQTQQMPMFFLVDEPQQRKGMLVFIVVFTDCFETITVKRAGFLHTSDMLFVYGRTATPGTQPYHGGPIVQKPTLIVPLEHLANDVLEANARVDSQKSPIATSGSNSVPVVVSDPEQLCDKINMRQVSIITYLRLKYLRLQTLKSDLVLPLLQHIVHTKTNDRRADLASQINTVAALALISDTIDADLSVLVELEIHYFNAQSMTPAERRMYLMAGGVKIDEADVHESLSSSLRAWYLKLVSSTRQLMRISDRETLTVQWISESIPHNDTLLQSLQRAILSYKYIADTLCNDTNSQ